MKIAIAGAGISGLSAANLLKEHAEVTVFEKEQTPGGLIKCERINDCLFHKVGGHIFNSKDEQVNNWFWSFFNKDEEFVKVKRNAKIFLDNKFVGYPIENYLFLLNKQTVKQIINELLVLHQQPVKSPFYYNNFSAFLKGNFGNTLYELYFRPYNEKIWQIDLNTVAMEWLEGKLPMPDLEEILLSNILKQEETTMVHSTFFYPREGGSQFIVDRLKENITLQTNMYIDKIGEKGGKLLIKDHAFDKLIYCGDVRKLPAFVKQLLKAENVDVSYIESLRSNGTSNLFCETDDMPVSWLYLPENCIKAHRIIYTGNFSTTNNRGSSRKTCVVEFSGKVDHTIMAAETKKMPGNLKPLGWNYEPNSYVIQDKRTRTEISAAKKVLGKYGIYLLGRFAEWEYYNMDAAIKAAFDLRATIMN
jgi:protoporphyrinogen oxidase